ncbi:MAG: S-adenosylmethionine:tRNA ribosyltransferase-isomerase [Bacteroidota bacterium]
MPQSARDLSMDVFAYELPDARIARYPVGERDAAKQLHYRDGKISQHIFRELPQHLPESSLLVGNRTRVIHARLFFPLGEAKRPIEIFCLDPLHPVDHAQALGARTQVQWKCLIGGNRRWKRGPLKLEVPQEGHSLTLVAERLERVDNTFRVAFSWESDNKSITFGEVLSAAGSLPLPPYLGRETEAEDEDRYQTVFAQTEGSVAAPTAGLHFSPAVLEGLKQKGIDWHEVTLHVGAGTFKPVDAPTLGGHDMHREYFTITLPLLEALIVAKRVGNPIVSVGTTSLRCLESLYYLGAECHLKRRTALNGPVSVDQWVAEDPQLTAISPLTALESLKNFIVVNGKSGISGYTQLLLTPAATIKVAEALITNFHQPHSTLLLLVAALVGDDWHRIYDYALENDFRFLSYGDSSLLWKR